MNNWCDKCYDVHVGSCVSEQDEYLSNLIRRINDSIDPINIPINLSEEEFIKFIEEIGENGGA